MSTPTNLWQDRRGMFQKGKEVHEPGNPIGERRTSGAGIADAVRRASVSSVNSIEKTISNTGGSATSSSGQRRRSSNSGGLFNNLTNHKRGSEDYAERRSSTADHGQPGMLSGWYNSTFRGVQKPPPEPTTGLTQQQEQKRGVME